MSCAMHLQRPRVAPAKRFDEPLTVSYNGLAKAKVG